MGICQYIPLFTQQTSPPALLELNGHDAFEAAGTHTRVERSVFHGKGFAKQPYFRIRPTTRRTVEHCEDSKRRFYSLSSSHIH